MSLSNQTKLKTAFFSQPGTCDWSSSLVDESESSGSKSSCSTKSWLEEADNDVTVELKKQYDKFEAALYSETNVEQLPTVLQEEVKVWNKHTPHLRVVGKQIKADSDDVRTNEKYSDTYEETFAEHFSEEGSRNVSPRIHLFSEDSDYCYKDVDVEEDDATKEKLRKAVEQKLKSQIWPTVLKIVRNENDDYVVGGQRRKKSVDFLDQDESTTLTSCPTRQCKKTSGNKLPQPVERKNNRPRSKAPSRKFKQRCVNEHETSSTESIGQDSSFLNNSRNGILPPIENLSIAPRFPKKRANSAVTRFSRVQPRLRPNTSRSKSPILIPLLTTSANQHFRKSSKYVHSIPQLDEEVPVIPYPSKTMNSRNKLPQRWKY